MALPNASKLSREARADAAEQVRGLADIQPWPDLQYFNSAPCPKHAPDLVSPVLCRRCGIVLRRHQRIGAAWMYLGLPGMLSDTVGSGKTAQVLAMLAMCKETGELGLHNRAVIVTRAAAVHDPWGNEIRRLLPGVAYYVADGTKQQRMRGYMGSWEVAVISDRTFAAAKGRQGDVDLLDAFPVGMLFYDDVDPMRNHRTQAARAINRLAAKCSRVNGAHATPLQKRLTELWCMLEPVGGRARLGSLDSVQSRYVTNERRYIVVPDPTDRTGRRKITRAITVESGITSNPRRVAEFRELVRPLVLRRTAEQLDDVDLPALQYNPVAVELSPGQRKRYAELRAGTLKRLSSGVEVTEKDADAVFLRGMQICSGLATLDTGAGADDSAKLDKMMDMISGDLSEEKVIGFIYFKQNIVAMSARLKAAGVDHVLMWSGETDKRVRAGRLERFREDPRCKVLLGTTTIEASLNLQVSRHVIAADTILNPARMTQLTGRARRQGNPYPTVYFHHLLAVNTQEDGYRDLLAREAGISDTVWEESTNIYQALTARQRMAMVAYGRVAA